VRILFTGDLHGNIGHLDWVLDRGVSAGASVVIQCGDHGYWPHVAWGREFLDRAMQLVADRNVELWWLDGNHDNHTSLARLPRDDDGLITLAPGYRYLPRGACFALDGVEFLAHGGAWSVDHWRRVPDVTWWEAEEITPEQVSAVAPRPVDVLVTHEAPAGRRLSEKDDYPRSVRQRLLVEALARRTLPRLVVHGHHHVRSDWQHPAGYRVVGLGCDGMGDDSVWVLDTAHIDRCIVEVPPARGALLDSCSGSPKGRE
jgi:hypothetical protein